MTAVWFAPSGRFDLRVVRRLGDGRVCLWKRYGESWIREGFLLEQSVIPPEGAERRLMWAVARLGEADVERFLNLAVEARRDIAFLTMELADGLASRECYLYGFCELVRASIAGWALDIEEGRRADVLTSADIMLDRLKALT